MKKSVIAFFAVGTTIILSGCGKDYSGDGKKLADLVCKAQQLQTKAASNPSDMALLGEATKLMTEQADLLKTLEAKYTESEKEELQRAFLAATSACK